MPDARDITQRIAGWLQAGRVPEDASAEATADAYAVLTRRAGARLNRCASLLAQGLRSEAVQEAEAEPELLREIAALELPDDSAWGDACRRNGWALPETIRPDVAALLNRAYADEALVEPLLREYRLRCVVRAPLRARLAALRALAGVDRGNRLWHDALIELERARHREMRGEVRDALGDVETLQELRRELGDDRQKLRPPADLVRAVDEALQDGRIARAQRRLEALLPELETAYSAMDFPAAERLLGDWSMTLKAVGRSALHVPEVLRERVEPIMHWVDRQAQAQAADLRFREACEALRDETSRRGPSNVLASKIAEAAAFERPLPGTLGEDVDEALTRRRSVERRRRGLRNGALVAAALVVLALTAGTLREWRMEAQVATQLADVRDAAEAGRLTEAEAGWSTLTAAHPARLEDAVALNVRGLIDQRTEDERQRRADFAEAMQRFDATPVEAWTSVMLEEADRLAVDEAERAAWRGKQSAFADQEAERARRANTEALEALAALRESLNAWPPDRLEQAPEDARAAARSVVTRLERHLAEPRLEASSIALLETLGQRAGRMAEAADAALSARQREADRLAARESLLQHVHDPDALATELRAWVQRFPEAPDTSAFERSAGLADAWRAVTDWRAMRGGWPSVHPGSPREAAERLQAIGAYRVAHPDSPWDEAVAAYADHWGRALLASSDDGPWKRRLVELMQAPAFRDLGMVTTNDGRRFYVVGDADWRETSLGTSIRVALTPDLSRLTPMDFPKGVLGPVELSPQAALANRLLSRVAAYEFLAWDTFAVDVVEEIYAADAVDDVLRGLLLGLVLDAYAEAVGPLDGELASLRSRLALHVDDTANWMNPDDRSVQRAREALAEVFAAPPDFAGMRLLRNGPRVALGAGVTPNLVGEGLLLRDSARRASLRFQETLPEQRLGVFGMSAERPSVWRQIGERSADGAVRWLPDAERVPSGSPVWFAAEATP